MIVTVEMLVTVVACILVTVICACTCVLVMVVVGPWVTVAGMALVQ